MHNNPQTSGLHSSQGQGFTSGSRFCDPRNDALLEPRMTARRLQNGCFAVRRVPQWPERTGLSRDIFLWIPIHQWLGVVQNGR
jgi:hypothetical protein